MAISISAYAWCWLILVSALVLLALYRKLVTRGEHIMLHVRKSEASLVPYQAALAHKLDRIDRWGKTLTIVVILYSLILPAVYLLYLNWWD